MNFSKRFMEHYLMKKSEELEILKKLTDILDRLCVNYAIGGSIASSIYGKVRFTQDADITVEPFDNKAEEFFQSVGVDFYISKDAMYQALKQQTSFNIIHFESAFKIDIFVLKNTDFEKQLITRRKFVKLSDDLKKSFSIVSAEDIILLKLRWYRDGQCSSQRQWDDVLGILAVQGEKLNFSYMKKWSAILEIDNLLENAISENKEP